MSKIIGNAVITGGNRGIGLALSQQLKACGYTVVVVHRKAEELPELATAGLQQIPDIDVTQPTGLRAALEAKGIQQIDLLINNAGILLRDSLGQIDYDGLIKQFEVNSLGPLKVSEELLPLMQKGSKLIHITSRMGSIEDNSSGGMYGYRMSKAALNAAAMSLAVDLKSHGIPVAVIHPGFVQTDMTGGRGLICTDESAIGILKQIDRLELDDTGTFWHMNGTILPW